MEVQEKGKSTSVFAVMITSQRIQPDEGERCHPQHP